MSLEVCENREKERPPSAAETSTLWQRRQSQGREKDHLLVRATNKASAGVSLCKGRNGHRDDRMTRRLCQLCWLPSAQGHKPRAQTCGCKPLCQMLEHGPPGKPGHPSWHAVLAILQAQWCRQGSVGEYTSGTKTEMVL